MLLLPEPVEPVTNVCMVRELQSSETPVSEHLDRLVEIFNVCWPMYAAMPAILKEAMELAYKDAGWDMGTLLSRCALQ